MKLTANFTLEELTRSSKAVELKIDNTPSVQVLANLTVLANGLEQVRALLDVPMTINSGYRCPELNKAVGGVAASDHIWGWAADFVAPKFGTPNEIVKAIQKSRINVDQCITENNSWVHISFNPSMRQQFLTATFKNGKTTYTKGI